MSTLVRSFGVKVIVVLDLVLGMLLLLTGLIMQTQRFPAFGALFFSFGIFNGLAAIVFTLIDFILAYAVWSCGKWAWGSFPRILTLRHRCFRIRPVCQAANWRVHLVYHRFGNCVLPNATRSPTLFRQRLNLAGIEGLGEENRLVQFLL